ncbi:MAG TPA: carbon-phosphorus lyase complex subunit PhnI [Capillimicrobium sp.]|nr:carbon-phosphorus lyase complex subunit PhnI [Capillimicrobium sp.]
MYATLHASERAVAAARRLAAPEPGPPPDGLRLLVDQVCAEAGTYDEDAARRALAQADGDVAGAVTLLRVWAATLPALASAIVAPEDERLTRRVSAAFADVPAGQWLGAAPQMRSRLLRWEPDEGGEGEPDVVDADEAPPTRAAAPRVGDLLAHLPIAAPPPEGDGPDPALQPLTLPATRGARLAALARGETGALVALAALGHARQREEVLLEATQAIVGVRIPHPRTGAPVRVAGAPVSRAEVITDAEVDGRPGFAIGFGATLGRVERRAIAIAIVDGGLQAGGEGALRESEILAAADGLATSGFVEHLCLPHYASFASYLSRVAADAEEDDE